MDHLEGPGKDEPKSISSSSNATRCCYFAIPAVITSREVHQLNIFAEMVLALFIFVLAAAAQDSCSKYVPQNRTTSVGSLQFVGGGVSHSSIIASIDLLE